MLVLSGTRCYSLFLNLSRPVRGPATFPRSDREAPDTHSMLLEDDDAPGLKVLCEFVKVR